MRVSVLICVLLLGVAGLPADSHAEKVKTNQSTKLFARPGEQSKVLLKVKAGQGMTILAKEGRWLKVRVSGRTGYVARSTVDMEGGDEIARNTRRRPFVDGRGTKRSFGGEGPDDRVGADALGEGKESGGDEAAEDGGDDDAAADEDADEPKAKPTAKKPESKAEPKAKPTTRKPPDGSDDEDPNADADSGSGDDDADADADAGADADEAAEDAEPTRKQARVAAKSTAYSEPDGDSEAAFVVKPGMTLYPGDRSGEFTEVENEEGDLGYVLTSELEVEESGGGGGRAIARGGRQIDVRVRAGVSYLTQALRTPGGPTAVPDNYNIATAAATLALGGAYFRPYKASFVVGGELTYDYAKAIPGIKVPMDQTTSVSLHNLNVRGIFGYDLKRKSGMMVLGRLGLKYQSFQVSNAVDLTKNTATLPSEIIIAPMLGVALAMPRLTQKIGLRFSLDAMLLAASFKQTKNLEDGASPSAKGA
ncbi:MAG: SH3 domain-containing protein, partial [Deltaproteobacteria bacterium]|nr:SH3 domain-containing protein [Deltaproteobacteria bacterium]